MSFEKLFKQFCNNLFCTGFSDTCFSIDIHSKMYIYKDLFTHKDINTYINGVVKICLNEFFENTGFQRKREKICKIMHK